MMGQEVGQDSKSGCPYFKMFGDSSGKIGVRGSLAVWRLEWSGRHPFTRLCGTWAAWSKGAVSQDTNECLSCGLSFSQHDSWLWGHTESDDSQKAGWRTFSDLLRRVREGRFHCILLVTRKSAQIQGKETQQLPQSIGSGDLFSTVSEQVN